MKPHVVLIALCMSVYFAIEATPSKLHEGTVDKKVVRTSAPTIMPLDGNETNMPTPSKHAVDLFENMNGCAGTVHHYKLPPTGYLPPPESAESRSGQQLYNRLDCASCHKIKDAGGTLGPPLDGIGGARGEQFITAHLLDPEKQMSEFPDLFGGRPNLMPHPGIKMEDAKLISKYLLTLPEPAKGFLVVAHPKIGKKHSRMKVATSSSSNSDLEPGRSLFLSHGCAACHTINNSVPRFGPKLDGISQRRTRKTLEEAMHGGTDEPEMNFKVYHLTNEESKQIVDFLMKLPSAK
ncbi:hypothetical protein BH10CYA1_BH10CYA1_49880 [soil metagenome]